VRFVTDPDIVGIYGGHSPASLAASHAYDATGLVTARGGVAAPPLWLCGHFAAKALAAMLVDLNADGSGGQPPGRGGADHMLWMTKSAVQPRGEGDEWSALRAMPAPVRAWADRGEAMSSRRPGKVDTEAGAAEDYRGLMKRVVLKGGHLC
jgi:hypothetical protein